MVIGETQMFLIIILITGLIGMRRGWAREVITTAIVLATVVFLVSGGVTLLGRVLSALFGGAAAVGTGTATGQPTCAPINTSAASELVFVGMTWLGYSAGTKYGNPVKNHLHRLAGLLAGIVNGSAIAYFVSHSILPGASLLLYSPTDALTSSILPIIFGGGLLVLAFMLFFASQSGKSGGK